MSTGLGLAGLGLAPVSHLETQVQLIVNRRSGLIVTSEGALQAVYGRWWPYQGTHLHALYDQYWRQTGGDYCQLYYHVPWNAPQFLTLDYIRSPRTTCVPTIQAALFVLDEIARLKGSLAIVCNVINDRLTDRVLQRWGWEKHCAHWSGRHFIKRFYGHFPTIPTRWRARLQRSVAL